MKISILYAVICLALVSCKKDPEPVPQVMSLKFSPAALDYVRLQQGKYFIYKDSATGNQDSVVVSVSHLQTIRMPAWTGVFQGMPEHDAQQLELKLIGNIGSGTTDWLHAIASTENEQIFINSDTVPITLLSFTSPHLLFFKYFDHQKLESFPSMTVEGRQYDHVITIISQYGSDISDPIYKKSTCYWAKGIGIIKRQTITTGNNIKTETLLRHN